MLQNHWRHCKFSTPSSTIKRGLSHWEGRSCYEYVWNVKDLCLVLRLTNDICCCLKCYVSSLRYYLCVWFPMECTLHWVWTASLWILASKSACIFQKFLLIKLKASKVLFYQFSVTRFPKIVKILHPFKKRNPFC